MSASKCPLELLKLQLKFWHRFHLLPFRLTNNSRQVQVVECEPEKKTAWVTLSLISTAFTLIEVLLTLTNPLERELKLGALLFHGLLLLYKCSVFTAFTIVLHQSTDYSHLINSLLSSTNKKKGRTFSDQKETPWLYYLIAGFYLVVYPILWFGTSLVSLYEPCVHPTYASVFSCKGTTWLARGVSWLLQLAFTLPSTAIAATIGSLCLIALSHLLKKINSLRSTVAFTGVSRSNNWLYCHFVLGYGAIQNYAILLNGSKQNFIFPLVQLNGALNTIALQYSVVIFWENLHKTTLLGVIMLYLLYTGFTLLMLELGSWSILASKKILGKLRRNPHHQSQGGGGGERRERKWWRMFLKSCQPISVGVGPFHKMDKRRGPALIRFCLQRTVFFVVNTRTARN